MYTKFIADNRIPTHTCDEILREMSKYKNNLTAMCEEYGYCEVVNALYLAEDNLAACIDWDHIDELLDEYLWNELIPEFVVPYAETDLAELTLDELSKAAKEAVHNSPYHSPKGFVAIDMTSSNAHSPEEVLYEMTKCCADLEKLSEVYSWDEIIDAIYFARKAFTRVDWEHIEKLLDQYLWDELISEYVIAPAEKTLQTQTGAYCFNLGIADEEVEQIRDGFYTRSEDVEVFEKSGSIYAAFYASSENEIDRMIEDACNLLLYYYPTLNVAGGAFKESPLDVA